MSWGHKITISLYVEGELTDKALEAVAKGASDYAYAQGLTVDYLGMRYDPVNEKPKDQG